MSNLTKRKTTIDKCFDLFNIAFMGIFLLIMFYPLYYVVIASFSEPYAVAQGKVFLTPVGFTLDAYKNVFENQRIWQGYRNTVVYTLFGTMLNLILTLPTAYVLSKKHLPGRNVFSVIFLIPMYFGGGLIPTYLLIKDMGLLNTPVTLIILGGLSIYNMIVCRVFFQTSIPTELFESAKVDGAPEFVCFFKIALPIAVPIVAVMGLYYGVARWNDYYTALIYISSSKYNPLQMVLRDILIQNQSALLAAEDMGSMDTEAMELATRRAYMAEAMKYALIFIASAPLLIAYPFVQKYFVKGMMIGALKG